MERMPLAPPELAIIAGTRAMLGAGLGLLLADRLDDEPRRAVGWTLLAIGALTTIPIVAQLVSSSHQHHKQDDDWSDASRRYEYSK